MSVIVSVATSADGYIDDRSRERLVLSTAADWQEVYQIRAAADAIVIGAQTLRADNPRLSLKCEELRARRVAQGRTPEPHKVIISGSGPISPSLRIFDSRENNIIIFSQIPRPELNGLAEVVVEECITAAFVRGELERRGLCEIMVEGGAQILDMFLHERVCVDEFRVAVNPTIEVGDSAAPCFDYRKYVAGVEPARYLLDGMEIYKYTLVEDTSIIDREFLDRAVELSRKCRPSATSYCVGAVVVTRTGEIFEGYTHETSSTHHAEQEAIKKAEAAGADLCGATIYSSMEPCSQRSSEPESCSEIIIRHKFSRVVFSLYEPSHFVDCKGALNMRRAGVSVVSINALAGKVLEINKHVF